ncbi:hypothetical protein [Actinomadura sp. WMMB 499]|uniref:hypothetical protein n=1 Tax=Actinomadura sp. WMMB 499 TaxID=1219491 RepID=UPI001245EDB9|nr:hypothetical protein [Actinomadura sp. WMMB 499]QFG24911.1 hypothetical protein F7P10_31020 [Actinomadura sp. WMMB 499]
MSEVRITGAEGPDGLSLRTEGLSARGRPELAVSGLPPYLGHGWARVLGALAGRVAAAPETPAEVTLAPGAVVRLRRSGDTLTPVPPAPGADPGEWRRELVVRLFPEASA